MTRVSLLLGLAITILLGSATGCGSGSSQGGKSLNQQYQDALKISDAGQRARKLATLAKSQQTAGDVIGMGEALASARQAAMAVKDPGSKSSALLVVAEAAASLEQSQDDIKSLLREAGKAIESATDPDVRVTLLADLAAATGKHLKNQTAAAAHLKTAEEAAEEISDSSSVTKVTALTKIAVAYGKLGSSADAERVLASATEFAQSLADEREKCDCLAEMAVAQAKMQNADASKALFASAEEAAGKIMDPESQGYAFLNLARKAAAAKNKSQAGSLLDQASAAADKVTDSGARGSLQQEISAERKSS
jgi:hypothetical protein